MTAPTVCFWLALLHTAPLLFSSSVDAFQNKERDDGEKADGKKDGEDYQKVEGHGVVDRHAAVSDDEVFNNDRRHSGCIA